MNNFLKMEIEIGDGNRDIEGFSSSKRQQLDHNSCLKRIDENQPGF